MKDSDLNRAVANATGESVSTIKRLGFLLAEPDHEFNERCFADDPYIIDWDELHAQRNEGSRHATAVA